MKPLFEFTHAHESVRLTITHLEFEYQTLIIRALEGDRYLSLKENSSVYFTVLGWARYINAVGNLPANKLFELIDETLHIGENSNPVHINDGMKIAYQLYDDFLKDTSDPIDHYLARPPTDYTQSLLTAMRDYLTDLSSIPETPFIRYATYIIELLFHNKSQVKRESQLTGM